jgi:hypothetical protein
MGPDVRAAAAETGTGPDVRSGACDPLAAPCIEIGPEVLADGCGVPPAAPAAGMADPAERAGGPESSTGPEVRCSGAEVPLIPGLRGTTGPGVGVVRPEGTGRAGVTLAGRTC